MFGLSTGTLALIVTAMTGTVFGVGWGTGYNAALRKANVAQLKADLNAARADIALHKLTAEQAKAATAAMEKAASDNAARIKELADALDQSKASPDRGRDACRIDPDTARRLRAIR